MRAALYVRVSTEDQAQEGYSIDAQKRRLLAYADSQDWQLAEMYIDDGYSAKNLNRPEIMRLLTDLKNNKFDVVLVYKLDRLTRSTSDCDYLLKTFEAYNVAFQSCTESFETRTATGRLLVRLVADIAQWERENTGERVRLGMEQKALEGKKPGGRFPFGYDKKGEIVPEEAETLRRLRELYMEGKLGFKSIAIALNNEGLTRRGYHWRSSTAALALENPFYAGIVEYGSKLPDGKYPQRKRELRVEVTRARGLHEPIWSEEDFHEHVRLMRMRTHANYSRKMDYWFSGVLRCGNCGQAMYGRLTTKKSLRSGEIVRRPFYICGQRKENDVCHMPIFQQKHVEHLLMEYIQKLSFDHTLTMSEQRKIKAQKETRAKIIAKLKRDIEQVKEAVKKWQYMYINDLVKAEDLQERLQEEYAKEADYKKQIDLLLAQEVETPEIQNQLTALSEMWPELGDMERKEIIMSTFETITVHTNEFKPKGVKNKFFPAWIEVKYRN